MISWSYSCAQSKFVNMTVRGVLVNPNIRFSERALKECCTAWLLLFYGSQAVQHSLRIIDMLSLSQIVKTHEIKTPRDLYKQLRNLWTLSLSGEKNISLEGERELLRHPFVAHFPPSVAIAKLLCPAIQLYLPESSQDVDAALKENLSLPECCELALFWALHGEKERARELILRILPLLKFNALFVSEANYDPFAFYYSAYLLYSYVGLKRESALCKMAIFGARDPFFSALEKALGSLREETPFISDGSLLDSPFGHWVQGDLAVTYSAKGSALGAFHSGEVEVRAFGPQFYPLTDPSQFGLSGLFDLQTISIDKISGWVSTFSQPEVWLQVEANVENVVHIRWVGLKPEKKGVFAFYVKAKTAHVEDLVFHSKSLQRSRTLTNEIRFNGDAFAITSGSPRNFEVIPLAGEGCFWNADFLIAFEMSPFDAEEWFSFKVQTERSHG